MTRAMQQTRVEETHLSGSAVDDPFPWHRHAFPRGEKSGLFIPAGMGLGESRSGDSRDAGQR